MAEGAADERQAYANNLIGGRALIAVAAKSNRSKADVLDRPAAACSSNEFTVTRAC
ncbi:hypothetical protein ACWEO1_36205 [Kitasatospora cineracea]